MAYLHRLSLPLLLCLSISPALADSNTLYITQDNTGFETGNSLYVDQSGATGSEIGGLTLLLSSDQLSASVSALVPLSDTAVQTGPGNAASIEVDGGGEVILYQNSRSGLTGNQAAVYLSGGGLAAIGQIGSDNIARLEISGALSDGAILQNGDGNKGLVRVNGSRSSGTIVQNGDFNDVGLEVSGNRAHVVYTQIGSGLNAATATVSGFNPLTGVGSIDNGGVVSVWTNNASVAITQTQF